MILRIFRLDGIKIGIGEAQQILGLTAEIGIAHTIGNGIDGIAHIVDGIPAKGIALAAAIAHGAILHRRCYPLRCRTERRRVKHLRFEPSAQCPHLSIQGGIIVSPSGIFEIHHTQISGIAHHLHLSGKFRQIPAGGVEGGTRLANVDMAVEFFAYHPPPLGHFVEIPGSVPIHLRRNEVDGAARHPRHRVAIDLIVLPIHARAGVYTIFGCHIRRRACHTGRTDAEAHPGLGALNHGIHISHHLVHIFPSPVGLAERAALRFVGFIKVGIKRHATPALIVEIIVEHQAIHIIFGDNVFTHIHHPLSHLRDARIEHGFVVGGE